MGPLGESSRCQPLPALRLRVASKGSSFRLVGLSRICLECATTGTFKVQVALQVVLCTPSGLQVVDQSRQIPSDFRLIYKCRSCDWLSYVLSRWYSGQ